ncbi:MAG: tRNA (N6-threonylcarbamoyladenosine(37)-N6)-methyltransferase TrmO [Promethearchaeota archaeon]|nr:MAG: tRNA (N6-threonylcarbamoyladenosine(37)-N6)-methyltransferase TrmO [Candidatus Lokiarchaeota archaeon]
MKTFSVKPIGFVRNSIDEECLKFEENDIKLDIDTALKQINGPQTSKIIIGEEYEECLDGIEDFSHLNISFWTHLQSEKAREIKKVHPVGSKRFPIKGIFATRSPVRPNPVCQTTVKLIKRQGNSLIVEGLDAIDETPIIDIKPHLPYYDSPTEVHLAEWMYQVMDYLHDVAKSHGLNEEQTQYASDYRAHPCLKLD